MMTKRSMWLDIVLVIHIEIAARSNLQALLAVDVALVGFELPLAEPVDEGAEEPVEEAPEDSVPLDVDPDALPVAEDPVAVEDTTEVIEEVVPLPPVIVN